MLRTKNIYIYAYIYILHIYTFFTYVYTYKESYMLIQISLRQCLPPIWN